MPEGQLSAKQLRAMLRAQDYEHALPVLDALIRTNPNDAPAHWHRASCMEAFGRLDEALAEVKQVLRIKPSYAPARIKQAELAITLKERDSMAGAMAVSAARSSEIPMRQGKNLDEALAQFVSDDPLDMLATKAAYQIYQVGNEAAPNYLESRIEDYPQYQRAYARQALQAMTKAGFAHLGDYEPLHLREILGKPTLVRIYSGDQGAIFAASYRVAPKWPGWLGFLFAFFTGLWKKPALIELITAFSNGQYIVTNNSGGVDPFTFGGTVSTEQLPLGAKIPEVVKRHRARVAEYLGIRHKEQALRATTMDEMLPKLSKLAAAKSQYRKSIGYITDVELRKLLGKHYDLLADRVRVRLSALAKQ